MKLTLSALLLILKLQRILLIIFLCKTSVNCEHFNEEIDLSVRIVGGDELDDRTKWPWLVAFTHNEANNYFCGGSLISNQHVLGAAHCFQGKGFKEVLQPEDVTAHLGKFNLSIPNEPGSKSSWVSQIIIHPDWKYKDEKYDADIAVVVLGERVEFSEFIQPVSLPPQSEDDVNGKGTIAGWGQSKNSEDSNGSYEDTPMELEMPIIRGSKCYPTFPRLSDIASERMFCAGYESETKGACLGDSGGGFYVPDSSALAKFQVKGIVSSSLVADHTCDVNKFSLYTNVGWFVDWIKDTMKELEEIKWTEIELECRQSSWYGYRPDGFDVECDHSFTGPFNQNIRISSTPIFAESSWNADKVEELEINFGISTHLFSGIGKTFRNLKKLKIVGSSVKVIKRHDFANLSNLKRFELRGFRISFTPEDTFFDLPALETLKIEDSQLRTLPPNLLFLSNNLIELELKENNHLIQIPDEIFKSSLMSLTIDGGDKIKLKNYSIGSWNLPELKELKLSFLHLSELPENLLPNSKKLKKLDLSWNGFKKLDKKFKENIPELEVLDLVGNYIELAGDTFTEFLKLKELNLRSCRLNTLPEGVFDSLTQLEALNLDQNQLTILSENIFAKNLNLKRIYFWENQLSQIKFDFTTLKRIEEINLNGNKCIDEGFGPDWSNTSLPDIQNAININCQ